MKYSYFEIKVMAIAFEKARNNYENAGKCLKLLNALSARTGLTLPQCLDKIQDLSRG